MHIKLFITFILAIISSLLFAAEVKVEDRGNDWRLNTFDANNLTPTNLKYFHFYDVLPEEINFEVFKNKDLSNIGDKKLFVGYGIADAKGKDCISLPVVVNGVPQSREVCMPWWRIEREYKSLGEQGKTVKTNIFETLKKPRPPLLVNVCEKKETSKYYPGGKVVCTSYFDRLTDKDCWKNPQQAKCFVDNCGERIVNDCTYIETIVGDDTTLETAIIDKSRNILTPSKEDTKINLASHIYECKGGSLTSKCIKSKDVLMFPYECKVDNPETGVDDGEYTYCDDKSPIYDAGGEIVGFNGKCANGKSMICEVNKFQNTTAQCIDPIYEKNKKYTNYNYESIRTYKEYSVDSLSGEVDSYSGNENCLRSNTIKDSRDKDIYARVVGNGYLDDDIYILRHSLGGGFYKTYCNMQHAGSSPSMATNMKTCLNTKSLSVAITDTFVNNFLTCTNNPNNFGVDFINSCLTSQGYKIGPKPAVPNGFTYFSTEDVKKIYDCGEFVKTGSATKLYNGVPLSCLRNNGSYVFDEVIKILAGDIVSVQQNSEQEIYNGTPFAAGRNHYSSTKVVIDGVEAAPEVSSSHYPYYPAQAPHLRTWDNTTATFSLLFPFAGAYEIFFYNKNGEEVASANLDMTDFKEATATKAKNIKLGLKMELAPGISEAKAARGDDWVEWGGGVFGGRGSKDGSQVASPIDSYVSSNAVTNIIVKDLLMNTITPITLVYPLPYPNRVFVAKLNVYENRKYRCYNEFDKFLPPTATTTNQYVCSTNSNYKLYKSGQTVDTSGFQKWNDENMCQQNCFTQNTCSKVTIGVNDKPAYTCLIKGGEELGGDLGGNYFSDLNTCNSKCTIKNSCDTFNESNCVVVDEQYDNQAQDFTGRALYTKKKTTYRCSEEETKQVGCAKYNYTVAQGELNLDISRIGYETKDFGANFEKALAKVDMLEVGSQHIWSGWKGKCVVGMKMDSSYLSDPMTIMSYAMSAYSSYTQLNGGTSLWQEATTSKFGTTIGEYSSKMDAAFTEMQNTVYDNTIGKAGQFFGSEAASETVDATVSAGDTTSSWSEIKQMVKDANEFWDYKVVSEKTMQSYIPGAQAITSGSLITFGISAGMQILAPTEAEYKLAEKLLNPLANSSDVSVQAYNSCLTSIGLSFPAIVGYSFAENDATSKQLTEPWKHPIRLTTTQLEAIVQVMGKEYVKHAYIYTSKDNINLNIYASNSEAYIKAGQVVCAGHKVAQTMDYINIKTQKPFPTQGSSGASIAVNVALSAVAMVNPVLGFAMKVAMDLYTNMFTKINTCENESDAIARSMNEYKTNKFNKNDLCRETKSYCDKYLKLGFTKKCVRTGYDFCCYDKQTTKIFAEALKEQLNHDWSTCQGITINDLKNISFRECREGEVPSINKCIATGKFDEYKNTLFKQASRGVNIEGLEEQIRNAIATEN